MLERTIGILALALTLIPSEAYALGGHKCRHAVAMASCGACGADFGGYGPTAEFACAPAMSYSTQVETTWQTILETVTEQVPVTEMQTRYRTEYRTEQVPITRTVFEQVPVQQTQTRYRTETRSESYTVNRPVTETVEVPRTITEMMAVPKTNYQQRIYTVMRPEARTSYVCENYVDNEAVQTTRQVVDYRFWALARESHAISMAVDETLFPA